MSVEASSERIDTTSPEMRINALPRPGTQVGDSPPCELTPLATWTGELASQAMRADASSPPGYADWHPSPARTGNLLATMELRCEAQTPPPAFTRNLRGRADGKWSHAAIVNGSAAQNGVPRQQTPGLLLWKPENRPADPFTIAMRDHPDNDFSRRLLARGVDGPIATACNAQRGSSRPVAACTRSPVAAACGEQRSSSQAKEVKSTPREITSVCDDRQGSSQPSSHRPHGWRRMPAASADAVFRAFPSGVADGAPDTAPRIVPGAALAPQSGNPHAKTIPLSRFFQCCLK